MNSKSRHLLVLLVVFAVVNAAVLLTGTGGSAQRDVWEQTELPAKWKERVLKMIGDNHHQEAITALRNYLRHVPDDGNMRRLLGKVLFDSGRFEEARETYYAALLKDPDDFVSRNNMGVVLMKLGRERDALRELEDAFNDSEQGVFVAANLAFSYDLVGDRANAARFREVMRSGARNNTEELIPEDALMLDAEELRKLQILAAAERTAQPETH